MDKSLCSLKCWAAPMCQLCRRRKAPYGRDVPAAAAGGYCTAGGCPGHMENPQPGHYWPDEEPERRELARRAEEGQHDLLINLTPCDECGIVFRDRDAWGAHVCVGRQGR